MTAFVSSSDGLIFKCSCDRVSCLNALRFDVRQLIIFQRLFLFSDELSPLVQIFFVMPTPFPDCSKDLRDCQFIVDTFVSGSLLKLLPLLSFEYLPTGVIGLSPGPGHTLASKVDFIRSDRISVFMNLPSERTSELCLFLRKSPCSS